MSDVLGCTTQSQGVQEHTDTPCSTVSHYTVSLDKQVVAHTCTYVLCVCPCMYVLDELHRLSVYSSAMLWSCTVVNVGRMFIAESRVVFVSLSQNRLVSLFGLKVKLTS